MLQVAQVRDCDLHTLGHESQRSALAESLEFQGFGIKLNNAGAGTILTFSLLHIEDLRQLAKICNRKSEKSFISNSRACRGAGEKTFCGGPRPS